MVQVEMIVVMVVMVMQVEMKTMVQMVKVEMMVVEVQVEDVVEMMLQPEVEMMVLQVKMSRYLGEQGSLLPLFLQAVSHQPLHGFGTVAANLAEVWREVAPAHHEDYLQGKNHEEHDVSTT